MSVNSELAAAARWFRSAAERLPEDHRPDVSAEWSALLDDVEAARSDGAAQIIVLQWREDMAGRLAGTLAHAPLDGKPA